MKVLRHEPGSPVRSSILNCRASLQPHHGVNLVSNPKFTRSMIFRMFLTVHLKILFVISKSTPKRLSYVTTESFYVSWSSASVHVLGCHLGFSTSDNHTWSFVSGFLHLEQCYQESFTVQATLASLGFIG